MVIVSGATMLKLNVAVAVFCGLLLSLTVTVTLPEKADVGVPVMAPLEAPIVSPDGKLEMDQV